MSEPVDAQPTAVSAADFSLNHYMLAHWAKRFLACNPFYLVSAALLLYGFYRISVDPGFLRTEIAQLAFDLGSLQIYELLLVITAIWLVRRAAWYDATLLVWLENAFVLVPFILISQAGLIDQKQVWFLCFAAAGLVLARFHSLRRLIAPLNFPARSVWMGLAVLAANIALPIVYRILHESKVGTKLALGPAFLVNEYTWILLLPALCALVNFLPTRRQNGDLLLQRRWLPSALFLLWIGATGVHLFCLGYVYDFDLRPELVTPAIWVLLWTLRRRATEWVPERDQVGQQLMLVAPFLVTFLSANQPSKEVFLLLTVWNAILYGILYWRRREKLVLHLLLLTVVAVIGGLPQDWLDRMPLAVTREKCIGAATMLYCLLVALRSRDPRWGLAGAGAASLLLLACLRGPQAPPGAAQAGLVFLLLHSLRWEDGEHRGARALRWLAALAWIGHAFAWRRFGGAPWIVVASGSLSLATCLVMRFLAGHWGSRVIPIAALLVLFSGPAEAGTTHLQSLRLPGGLIAVVGSFVMFAGGTVIALTRNRWHTAVAAEPPDRPPADSPA
jgi:hypothetical protein